MDFNALVDTCSEDIIQHHGVKGMRWGVRHDNRTKTGTSSRSSIFSKKPMTKEQEQYYYEKKRRQNEYKYDKKKAHDEYKLDKKRKQNEYKYRKKESKDSERKEYKAAKESKQIASKNANANRTKSIVAGSSAVATAALGGFLIKKIMSDTNASKAVVRKMSENDLDIGIERLKKERQYRESSSRDADPLKYDLVHLLKRTGDTIVPVAAAGASAYLGKKIVDNLVTKEDRGLSEYMFPNPNRKKK